MTEATQTAGTAREAIEQALEVFVHGFSFTRSFTHPYVPERVEGVWALRDAVRRNGAYRTEEWFAHDVEPAEVDRLVRRHSRGRFTICAILGVDEPDEAMRAGYRALGYRLQTTEPIMVHALRRIPRPTSPATIKRVTALDVAQKLAKEVGARQILPEHLEAGDAALLRQYVALKRGQIVGWVRSVVVGEATWCSNMFVKPAHRRQGIGRTLLGRMLRDDRGAGASHAVLAASHTGAKLYTTMGYRHVATLYAYSPGRRG